MRREIVFVRDRPGIRIYKEVKALKKTGNYQLTLLCRTYDSDLFKGLFDTILTYNTVPLGDGVFGSSLRFFDNKFTHVLSKLEKMRLVDLVKKLNPDIFHCVTEPNHICRLVMEHANCPVVFDGYDFSGISEGIQNLPKEIREDEKYCLEHANGIIHKGLPFEIEFYKNKGYEINAPILRWLDYCDEDFFIHNKKKLSNIDNKIHLVYTGQVATNPLKRYNYYIPLAKKFSKQKINFHIYPPPFQGYRLFREYFDLEKNDKYFHFHNSMNNLSLVREISKYDYGLFIHEKKKYSPRFTKEKIKVIMGNKLFTCLEAGLPIIASEHLTSVKEIIEEYQIGFTIMDENIEKLSQILTKIHYDDMEKNVLNNRELLTINKNIIKLEKFYAQLIRGN